MLGSELTRQDFNQEGEHQWVAHRDGYRYVIRQIDGNYEVIIRSEIHHDPTALTWETGLRVCNFHLQYKRIANRGDADYKTDEELKDER